MGNVMKLLPYEVYEYSWGSAVKHRNGNWDKVFIKPNAQEIDLSNLEVIIHENGIEFI